MGKQLDGAGQQENWYSPHINSLNMDFWVFLFNNIAVNQHFMVCLEVTARCRAASPCLPAAGADPWWVKEDSQK